MPNGKPLIPDLDVLLAYAQRAGDPIAAVAAKHGLPYKQVWLAVMNKKRFCRWIDYGVCLQRGWLTPEGQQELARLQATH